MKYIIASILTPIVFVLSYIFWVFFIGIFLSFLYWDWSVITNNIFPWELKEPNVILRAVAGSMAFVSSILLWVDVEEPKRDLI